MADGKGARQDGERTIVRDISWCGTCAGANSCMVDVKDGKMLRIRPARYYEQYTKEEVNPWVMHARGKTFEPSDKSLIPPLSLAYKKRVYSPARIRYPDEAGRLRPHGRSRFHRPRRPQHPEPRHQQVRAHQLAGSARHRGRRDAARQGEVRTHVGALPVRPARRDESGARSARLRAQAPQAVGRLHPAGPPTRQLGRLDLGRQTRVGHAAGRPAGAAEQPHLRHLQERRTAALLGLRPGDHHVGLAGTAPEPA